MLRFIEPKLFPALFLAAGRTLAVGVRSLRHGLHARNADWVVHGFVGGRVRGLLQLLTTSDASRRSPNVRLKIPLRMPNDKRRIQTIANTSGVGVVEHNLHLSSANARAGDKIILSGTMGDHGVTIMLARGELELDADIHSDAAPLRSLRFILRTASSERSRCERRVVHFGLTLTAFRCFETVFGLHVVRQSQSAAAVPASARSLRFTRKNLRSRRRSGSRTGRSNPADSSNFVAHDESTATPKPEATACLMASVLGTSTTRSKSFNRSPSKFSAPTRVLDPGSLSSNARARRCSGFTCLARQIASPAAATSCRRSEPISTLCRPSAILISPTTPNGAW